MWIINILLVRMDSEGPIWLILMVLIYKVFILAAVN